MTQDRIYDLGRALRVAARSAFITFCVAVGGSLARSLVNDLFDGKWRVDWAFILLVSGAAGFLVFLWTFTSGYLSLEGARPASAILERDPSLSLGANRAMDGFVGMEYYSVILNRTYVVFTAPDGLYGWKVEGPVSASNPLFYKPYEEMLNDPALMRDRGAVEDLAKLKGGFFISGSSILSVDASYKSKWGMGGIAHSGRIRLRLTTGKSREFILLGSVSPEAIRDSIVSSSARSSVPIGL